MKNRQKLLYGSILILSLAIILGSFFNNHINAKNTYLYENYELFNTVFQSIRSYYYDVKKIKSKKLIYGAIKGMLKSLDDEHTSFLPPAELRSLSEDTSGQFGGLGIMIGIRDKKLTIISPIYGTPAWEKHLKPGDVITHINGKSTKGLSLFGAVSKLRGKVGSKVNISVFREGHDELLKITIIRKIIKIKTVKSKYLSKKRIGYIKITQFSNNTSNMLKKVLKKLARKKNIKALVIDLRNNPGGLLSSAIKVSDLFISKGVIVYTKGRDIDQTQYYRAKQSTTVFPDSIPIVILVNKGSASASEIFSGAMKDTQRGILVGDKTFGKGSVQTIRPLQDGSAIKLTIALYYTPSGKQIHKKGLTPSIKIKIPEYTKLEQKSIFKLIHDNFLRKFLKKHPKYNNEDVKKFSEELKKKSIKLSLFEINRWLYWEKNKIGTPKLINMKYDLQLRKAIGLIENGKIKRKKIVSYKAKL